MGEQAAITGAKVLLQDRTIDGLQLQEGRKNPENPDNPEETPEIEQAVRTDKMKINSAYNLIQKTEKGENPGEGSASASGVKKPKIVISEENFARLKDLEGDVGVHVNNAIEVYLDWLQHNGGAGQPGSS